MSAVLVEGAPFWVVWRGMSEWTPQEDALLRRLRAVGFTRQMLPVKL